MDCVVRKMHFIQRGVIVIIPCFERSKKTITQGLTPKSYSQPCFEHLF